MKLILTALRQEARPIIEGLELKHDPASRKIPVYAREGTLLVVSGIGKLYAAVATAHAYHIAGQPENCHLFNIGMCGGATDNVQLGQALRIHKIWDAANGREYFPDILLEMPLEDASLGTFDKPVKASNRPNLTCDLVDMEASGIFQAAHLFMSPLQMTFIKVVTDYLSFTPGDYPEMIRYFEESAESWLPILKETVDLDLVNRILSSDQERFLSEVVKEMRFTKTQSLQLMEAAAGYVVRGGKDLEFFKPVLKIRPKHKSVRNEVFNSMLKDLNR